ncbi:MAG: hypothetical protein NC079_07095 [Clostridium sp.]|nr:hypothetical protein [Acetatifactor muris]MCM1527860.1 hypothetical protein [Bacteroides sp.]MCM1563360.1 hypothetical protein [Clostridium sp.]
MKKSSLPVISIWFLYGAAVGSCLFLVAISVAVRLGYPAMAGLAAGLAVLAAIGLIVWRAHGPAVRCSLKLSGRPLAGNIAEGLLVIVCLAGMIVWWIALAGTLSMDATWESAYMAETGFVTDAAHGGEKVYLYLLHGMMFLMGNRILAAMILQPVLLAAASLALYFGVRSLSGRIAASVTLIFMGFGTYMTGETHKVSSFLPVLFVFGLALGGIARIPDGIEQADTVIRKVLRVLHCVAVGVLIGVCFYMDAAGITLLLFLTVKICAESGRFEKLITPLGVFLGCLAVAILCYVGLHCPGGAVWDSISGQMALYAPGGFRVPVMMTEGTLGPDVPVLVALMAAGVFGFWHHQRMERYIPWFLAAVLLMGMQCFGMSAPERFNAYGLLYLFCAAMAGCSLEELFWTGEAGADSDDIDIAKTEDGETDEDGMRKKHRQDWESSQENQELSREKRDMAFETLETSEESEAQVGDVENALPLPGKHVRKKLMFEAIEPSEEESQVNYIENPLPLPKKHVRRVLDYDYEVPDDDDFDI